MQYRLTCSCAFILVACGFAYSQDKIYTKDGRELFGKVIEVGPREIKYTVDKGPIYVLYSYDIDSIAYASGRIDILGRHGVKKNAITFSEPPLNTISVDALGEVFNSFSISYERKVADNKIGLRFPLYINTSGAGMARYGTFNTRAEFIIMTIIFHTHQRHLKNVAFAWQQALTPNFT